MNRSFVCNLFLVTTLVFATVAGAQTQPGGRGGNAPAASSGPGSRGGRPVADPRPSVEAVEARFREINEEELKQPPKRDYKVEMGKLQKVKLFRADPKLFENKFVARLVLTQHDQELLQNWRGRDPRSEPNFPKEMNDRLTLDSGRLEAQQSLSDVLKELAERCPADQRPESMIKYLTSPESDRDIGRSLGNTLTFLIYAPSVEEAEARAAAIIRLYDCGARRPLQQYFYAEGKKRIAEARAGCEQFDKLTDEVRVEEEKIAKPSEVSSDILSQLKAQKIMVAVELAGLNARVRACDSMLSDPKKLEVSTLQSISDMKVKAEIERIGTKEKLDQINAFIADGDRREAISASILRLNGRRAAIQREVTYAADVTEAYLKLVAFYSPRPIEGNKIVISPVEWTEK